MAYYALITSKCSCVTHWSVSLCYVFMINGKHHTVQVFPAQLIRFLFCGLGCIEIRVYLHMHRTRSWELSMCILTFGVKTRLSLTQNTAIYWCGVCLLFSCAQRIWKISQICRRHFKFSFSFFTCVMQHSSSSCYIWFSKQFYTPVRRLLLIKC